MSKRYEILEDVRKARDIAQRILEIEGDLGSITDKDKSTYKADIYRERADKINMLMPVLRAAHLALPGFATIDTSLVENILNVKEVLLKYKEDESLKRPCNILMLAPPGSGKSHFVNCLVKEVALPAVMADLSAGRPYDVITFTLNEARNFKSQDEIPLIFFDEVDSDSSVLPSLLPLLWEGRFSATGQILNVGKCVIICAASTRELLHYQRTKNLSNSNSHSKLSDFLSRFNGGTFEIDTINEKRRLDRLAIAAALIQKRFKTVCAVSVGLLQFLTMLSVRYEVRSLEFLISLIPIDALKTWSFASPSEKNAIPTCDNVLYPTFVRLLSGNHPSSSALQLHISDGDMSNALDLWKRLSVNVNPVLIHT
jgi:hypothetical protein